MRKSPVIPTNPKCWTCLGSGVVVERTFDGNRTFPCPVCSVNETRRRMGQEFGTDAQRREIAARGVR